MSPSHQGLIHPPKPADMQISKENVHLFLAEMFEYTKWSVCFVFTSGNESANYNGKEPC